MCGIIGILSKNQDVIQPLLRGLERLTYRGYDSAGIATIQNEAIDVRKALGSIDKLAKVIKEQPLYGNIGIAHTRWATHGAPNIINSHPHYTEKVAIIHNGIIENHNDLYNYLSELGIKPQSNTDSELFALLLDHELDRHLIKIDAIISALKKIKGSYAFGILFADEPNTLYCAKQNSPLAIGQKDGDFFLGSDAIALSGLLNEICFLDNGDIATLGDKGIKICDHNKKPIIRKSQKCLLDNTVVSKGNYSHFMLKEIYEQPFVLRSTLENYLSSDNIPNLDYITNYIKNSDKITIIACGTSYYAALLSKYWLEKITNLPTEIELASEFRYRKPAMKKNNIAIFISQSGETADTIAALEYAKMQKQYTIGIVNVPNSTITRMVDYTMMTLAGPEIGVASTKAFITQLGILAIFTLHVAKCKKTLNLKQINQYVLSLKSLSYSLEQILENYNQYKEVAQDIMNAKDVLYLGRGITYPIALEGALKLKEISYIHAEGFAAGEMKHGPIALIDNTVPIISLMPSNFLLEKMLSNIQEAEARGGQIILITDEEGIKNYKISAKHKICLPNSNEFTAPFLYTLPMQFIAYFVAMLKGKNVDMPRNLAKSVTVE